MKLLIITSVIPYPLDEGGKISQFAFSEYMQNELELHYLLPIYNDEELEYSNGLQIALPNAHIHPVDLRNKKATKITNYQKFKLFLYKISDFFIKPKKTQSRKIINDFVRPLDFNININQNILLKLEKIIKTISPEIIQIEHNQFLSLVEAIPNNIKKVFVDHEIQFARLDSAAENKNFYENYKYNLTKNIELLFLEKYDAIFTFSEDDKEKLVKNLPKNKLIFSSPFPVMENNFEIIDENKFSIEKIIFVGGEGHFPNFDAVIWYLESMSEAIFTKTKLRTHIVGKWKQETIDSLSSEYIKFEGFVEDLISFSRNSIIISPIRIGSGIRTKILYSLAQHLPVISTNIGCEGIGLVNKKNIMICDTANSFTEAILFLVQNPSKAFEIAREGYFFTKINFSQEKLVKKRMNIYHQILDQ